MKRLSLSLMVMGLLLSPSLEADSSQDLIDAVVIRDLDEVHELLKNKEIDLEVRNEGGHTALHLAIARSEVNSELDPFVKALIEAGADVMARGGPTQGRPLHYAVFHYMHNGSGRMTIETLLQNEDVDVNATDKHRQTALHYAVFPDWLERRRAIIMGGHVDIIKLLFVRHDIKVNEMDDNGKTPLDLIIEWEWEWEQNEVKDGMYVLREVKKQERPYQMKFQKAIELLRSKGGLAAPTGCHAVY